MLIPKKVLPRYVSLPSVAMQSLQCAECISMGWSAVQRPKYAQKTLVTQARKVCVNPRPKKSEHREQLVDVLNIIRQTQ